MFEEITGMVLRRREYCHVGSFRCQLADMLTYLGWCE